MIKPGIAPVACISLAAFFTGLKLTNVINWSWIWVAAPIWIPLAAIVCIGMILFGMGFFVKEDASKIDKDYF